MAVEPGSIVVAPLGPRQLLGVAWEPDRLPANEVPDSRLRPLAGLLVVPPLAPPLRRLAEWTADYYLAPLASVLRMILPSSAALDGPRHRRFVVDREQDRARMLADAGLGAHGCSPREATVNATSSV